MAMQPLYTLTIKLPTKERCNLPDCQKATNVIRRIQVDNYNLNFCSPDHARVGIARWQEKKAKGITPTHPTPIEQTDMVGDNINEIEENE